MSALSFEQRFELSRALRAARAAKSWSVWTLAEKAADALRAAADAAPSAAERELRLGISITFHHVSALENCPRAPLGTPERRCRLLGVALALGIDRAEINRLAGGL